VLVIGEVVAVRAALGLASASDVRDVRDVRDESEVTYGRRR